MALIVTGPRDSFFASGTFLKDSDSPTARFRAPWRPGHRHELATNAATVR
jgi:hypothetical protein